MDVSLGVTNGTKWGRPEDVKKSSGGRPQNVIFPSGLVPNNVLKVRGSKYFL